MADDGWSHVVGDGKVVDSDRSSEKTTSRKGTPIDAGYSGKTGGFGGNIQGRTGCRWGSAASPTT